MFFPGSRYLGQTIYTTTVDGVSVTATTLPLPESKPLRGFHRRLQGQRLDLLSNRYLADPTAFWRLCDASGTVAPDALGARDLVAIPDKDG